MGKDEDIRSYSVEELRERRAHLGSQTDVARVRATTDGEVERQIAEDPDWRDIPADWYETGVPIFPSRDGKCLVELDDDVVAWFRQRGPDYPRAINAALRGLVAARRPG